MRTRDEHKQDLIRRKAIEIIAKVGFEGLSMHKLAKAAGVSSNTIYVYYKNREDLLVQIFNEVNEAITRATLEGFDPEMEFEEGVRLLWLNRYRYFVAHPLHLMLMEHFNNSDLVQKVDRRNHQLFNRLMTRFLEKATRGKQLAKMPSETYWAIAFAPLFQLLKFHVRKRSMDGKPYVLTEKMAMEACEHVLDALRQ